MGGNKYFVTFIDDYSRKLWTYLIKKKSEVIEVFAKFKSMVKRQNGRKLKVLRTDGGEECYGLPQQPEWTHSNPFFRYDPYAHGPNILCSP